MSKPNSEKRKDSASLLPPGRDWAYKKQVNRLGEISQQLALACSRIQDHGRVMRQCTEQLFGKMAPVDSPISPDVRVALLESLITIWNNFLSSNTALCASLEDEMARCHRSVVAAHQGIASTNPFLASQLPQLSQLCSELHAGRRIQRLPAPAPFLPPNEATKKAVAAAGGIAGAAQSNPGLATKIAAKANTMIKAAKPSGSQTAATEAYLPGGEHSAKRPCLAPPPFMLSIGASRKPESTPPLAPKVSHKRKTTTERSRHGDVETEATGPRSCADLKAQLDHFEQELLSENYVNQKIANLSRQLAL